MAKNLCAHTEIEELNYVVLNFFNSEQVYKDSMLGLAKELFLPWGSQFKSCPERNIFFFCQFQFEILKGVNYTSLFSEICVH
jgi:hypothetical protein